MSGVGHVSLWYSHVTWTGVGHVSLWYSDVTWTGVGHVFLWCSSITWTGVGHVSDEWRLGQPALGSNNSAPKRWNEVLQTFIHMVLPPCKSKCAIGWIQIFTFSTAQYIHIYSARTKEIYILNPRVSLAWFQCNQNNFGKLSTSLILSDNNGADIYRSGKSSYIFVYNSSFFAHLIEKLNRIK